MTPNLEKERIENLVLEARLRFQQLSNSELQRYSDLGRILEAYAIATQGAPPLPDQSDVGYAFLALLADIANPISEL